MLRNILTTTLIVLSISSIKAQNVGIGTTTPGSPLTIKTDGIGVSQESTDGSVKIGFYSYPNFAFVQTHSATDLSFSTNNNNAQLTLQKTTGNFGIGLTNPTAKLDVTGTVKFVDGTQGLNKVLTSDANGLASWKTPAAGGISFPYSNSFSTTSTIFSISNDQGDGISSYTPSDNALYGVTSVGTGVKGNANSGIGVSAFSSTGTAAVFESPSGLALKTVSGNIELNGKLKLADGTQSSGGVLTTNSTGNATWAKSSGFVTTKVGASQTIPMTNPVSYIKINFSPDDTQVFGTNGYNNANSDFTAPVTGFYHFDAMLSLDGSTNGSNTTSSIFSLGLYKRSSFNPGGTAIFTNYFYYTIPMSSQGISATVYLLANDIIDVRLLHISGLTIKVTGGNAGSTAGTYFSGNLVH